jgi:putative membrane protein
VINPTERIIDKAMRLIARGMAANRLKTVASGLKNIPADGPVLIVARHYHHLFDGLAFFAAVTRRFHIVVTLDWAQNQPTKFFFATINHLARWPTLLRGDALTGCADDRESLFLQRDAKRYQRKALIQSIDLLVDGRILVIFPEGYPNIDPIYTPKTEPEQFLPFKPGFVNIVSLAEKKLKQRIPIIPAGLHYTRGAPWVGHLRFGSPVYRDNSRTREELIETLEKAVKTLSAVND